MNTTLHGSLVLSKCFWLCQKLPPQYKAYPFFINHNNCHRKTIHYPFFFIIVFVDTFFVYFCMRFVYYTTSTQKVNKIYKEYTKNVQTTYTKNTTSTINQSHSGASPFSYTTWWLDVSVIGNGDNWRHHDQWQKSVENL